MLEIGSLIDGKYKILRVVGKGGMSVVYQAVNEKANKIWAIKEVRKDGVQNFEVVKQNLIVETELLKRFNHPNLPSIIDVIDGDGSFLIVMDYIEGNSLSKALETSGAQSQSDVIEWSKQLCDVLGYLHSRKPPIIYRDMKPANVMLKPDGNVSLIDFGTAREFKSSSVEDTTCLGTQGYAAPEQYGGHGQTDARTDIYCLGATMYHLVTGHNPSTPPYEMYPIRQWNPALSSGLEEIIIKCTQRNPDDRYQSCAELLYALDHYEDLDIENKKAQNFKWKLFITSMILTIVMLFATIGFSIASSSISSSTYDSLINKGEVNQDANSFINAIEQVDAGRVTAYSKLLDLYMTNKMLSKDENAVLKKLVLEHENDLISHDKNAYYNDFLMKYAQYLFFAYSADDINLATDNTGRTLSSHYFRKIVENTGNERAQTLLYLATNDLKNGDRDVNGDLKVDVSEYWNTLKNLVESDMVNNQNDTIKLRCYSYVASELLNNDVQLHSNGVTENDYKQLLQTLRTKVSQLPSDKLDRDDIQNAYDTIDEALSSGYGSSSNGEAGD